MPGPSRPKREYKFAHAVTEPQLTALGMVAVEGADLEIAVEFAIWSLMGSPMFIGTLFTTGQNFASKVKTFTRVANKALKDETSRDQAAALASRLRDSSKRRNGVIHALWPIEGEGVGRAAVSRRLGEKDAEREAFPADPESLRHLAADLRADYFDLLAFLDEAGIPIPLNMREGEGTA